MSEGDALEHTQKGAQLRIPWVTSTQLSSLKPTARSELCLLLRASPQGMAQDRIISESAHHKGDGVWGRICVKHHNLLKILADAELARVKRGLPALSGSLCPSQELVSFHSSSSR